MLAKRIIPCLDVDKGRVVKGVNFLDLRDAGDPVEISRRYEQAGADELVFLDITASHESRDILIDIVHEAAEQVFMPLTVGGGIRNLEDCRNLLNAGADKVSINSAAVCDPDFISAAAQRFGSQCIVLGMDPVRSDDRSKFPSGYEITVRGFRQRTGLDGLEWAKKAEGLGVGEIVVNSVDADGTRTGWLEVDLGSPQTVSRIEVDERKINQIRKFQVEMKKNGEWTIIYSGKEHDLSSHMLTLKQPVEGQVFRLNITETTGIPTVWEFGLYGK